MISRRLLRIKIFQVLYAHFTGEDCALAPTVKSLTSSIEKTYDLYCYLLLLPMALKRYAEQRIEIARNKKIPTSQDLNPNTRFVDNAVILQLENSEALRTEIENRTLSWTKFPELIRHLYIKLTETEEFAAYMNEDTSSYAADMNILNFFFEQVLVEDDMFFDVLEEQNIYWNDDVELVVSMVIKTLKANTAQNVKPLMPLYTDEEEDKEFAFALLRETIKSNDENQKLIDKYATNWDIERIAFADTLILSMAITEMVTFPSIPVKVTFDEYIELSKFYSTEKSYVFVNGILDKIIVELTNNQKIVKWGRGQNQ